MNLDLQRPRRRAGPWLLLAALLVACGSSDPYVEVFLYGDPTPASAPAGTTTKASLQFRVRASTEGDEELAQLNWLHLTCEVVAPAGSGLTVQAGGACDTRRSGALFEEVMTVELTVSAASTAPVGMVQLPVRFNACAGRKFVSSTGIQLDEQFPLCKDQTQLLTLQVLPAPAAPTAPPPVPLQFTGELLANAGFEQPVSLGTLPTAPGFWRGDLAALTPAVGPVAPRQGGLMLQFQATGPTATANLVSSQMWQLVDVRPWAAAIDAGGVLALGSAWFHRVTGTALTDRRFDLRLLAFGGEAAEMPARYAGNQQLGVAAVQVDTGGAAWQQGQAQLALPAGTRWVLVEIYAYEDVFNDAAAPEFDGHYADDMSLRLQLP